MVRTRSFRRMVGGLLALVLVITPAVWAQSAQSRFHEAYFLENERGDLAAAARLYNQVAGDRQADKELRADARSRGAACQEELASADFAKLMPSNTLVYAEVSRPGGQLTQLLQMLGLLRENGSVAADPDRRVAVSPALIRELLGIRGAAVAVTGFNPAEEMPLGVAVLHPGDIDVIRGLIETALPAGAELVEPIEGFPTFQIEGQVFVTLTKRLVIASTQRQEIEGVVLRLTGEETDSLADNADLAEVMEDRDDGLIFFCVNFKPVMPLLNAGLAAAGAQSRELAMAQALLDLRSLRTLVGRMGVSDAGLYLDVSLRLDEGHRNLAFHFLRMPAINPVTLERIPTGVAAFFAGALNEAHGDLQPARSAGDEVPPITMLDIGREIFANIVSFAVFMLPTEGETHVGGLPIPPVAAVITVHDPVKSLALWSQTLGVASLASGAGALEGMDVEIEDLQARRYVFPEGISVYLAAAGNDILISPSKTALAASLGTQRGGKSILQDPAFSKSLERLGPNTTFALFAHPGRCAKLAAPFMSPRELEEMQPVVEMLTDTVASVVMEHSNNAFRFSALVTGLPDVGPLVSRMIAKEQQRDAMQRQLVSAKKQGEWDAALETVEQIQSERPDDGDLLWTKFKILATGTHDYEAARAVGDQLLEVLHDDARSLNDRAWALLTEDEFGGKFDELALKLSRRSNELTDHGNWYYVDTLALALFETGDVPAAIKMEEQALELCKEDSRRGEVKATLKRFKGALEQ